MDPTPVVSVCPACGNRCSSAAVPYAVYFTSSSRNCHSRWRSCNDASKLAIGQAQYSGLLTPAGTFIDDHLTIACADKASELTTTYGNVKGVAVRV